MGLAISRMADQQIELERKVTKAHSRLNQAAIDFKGLDTRVTTLEKKLSPASLISDKQAEEIPGTVKALA